MYLYASSTPAPAPASARSLRWARRMLWGALALCVPTSMGGLLILLTIWLIAPLFIGSALLYALALQQPLSGRWERLGAAVAGLSTALSLAILAGSAHFRLLGPVALLFGATIIWLLRRRARRNWVLAGGLSLLLLGSAAAGLRTLTLGRALDWQDRELAELLLNHGADPNEISIGTTLLSAVADSGPEWQVALLLAHGADPNARDNYWHTNTPILFGPLWNKRPRLVNRLLAAGANPRLRDHLGRDAVQIACDYDYPDSVTVRRAAARFAPVPKPAQLPAGAKQ